MSFYHGMSPNNRRLNWRPKHAPRKDCRKMITDTCRIRFWMAHTATFILCSAVRAVGVDWILDDFNRLLPLYQDVEGKESFPKLSPGKPTPTL
jgi:hypothetical protein